MHSNNMPFISFLITYKFQPIWSSKNILFRYRDVHVESFRSLTAAIPLRYPMAEFRPSREPKPKPFKIVANDFVFACPRLLLSHRNAMSAENPGAFFCPASIKAPTVGAALPFASMQSKEKYQKTHPRGAYWDAQGARSANAWMTRVGGHPEAASSCADQRAEVGSLSQINLVEGSPAMRLFARLEYKKNPASVALLISCHS